MTAILFDFATHADYRAAVKKEFQGLKALFDEYVHKPLDHRNLNIDVAWFADKLASAENIAVYIWEQLSPRIPAGKLVRIRLWETPRNYVEYEGG